MIAIASFAGFDGLFRSSERSIHIAGIRNQQGIEPTNNRAERDLRPAVISRKVSQCSKNQRGAHAFEVFTSVLETIRKTTPSEIARALVQVMAGQPTIASP